MTPKFRILALAAMSLGAAMSAQAEPIGFETLALDALNAGQPLDLVPGSLQVPGFSFTGATVYHVNQTTASGSGPQDPNHAGFIQSRNAAGVKSQTISVVLAGNNAGGSIESVSYALAASQWTVDLEVFGRLGSTRLTGTQSEPSFAWTNQPIVDFTGLGLGVINRIDFISVNVPGQGFGTIALDDLNFSLSGIGGGGTIPEPASLALVMLALAGVGMASRSRSA